MLDSEKWISYECLNVFKMLKRANLGLLSKEISGHLEISDANRTAFSFSGSFYTVYFIKLDFFMLNPCHDDGAR